MDVRVKFLGAAQSVTGSKYLIEVGNFKFLFDCGLFQGLKELRLRNWDEFPIAPADIDCVIISHAHIDHTGYLPRLVKEGFTGPIYCTHPTADLIEILLLDSAKLQEEETFYARKKGYSRHDNPKPLYTEEDAKAVFPLLKSFAYNEKVKIHDRVEFVYRDAGHLLGSALTEVFIQGDREKKKIVFSGDIGRYQQEMLFPPTTIEQTDVLFIESTYGNKDNAFQDPTEDLVRIANDTFSRGGVLLIPAFAVGRTQSLVYYLRTLMEEKKIPEVRMYVDSPMAISSTYLFFKYPEYCKPTLNLKEIAREAETNKLIFVKSQEQSITLNDIKEKAIIISSSGMMTGGRILHHLYHRLRRPQDTVLVAGFQAEGTRGKKLLEGEKTIKIFGEDVPVKCNVEFITSMSGHADRGELFQWMKGFKNKPKITFTVHGEGDDLQVYAQAIRDTFGWNVRIPEYLESVDLFTGI